MPGRCSVPVAAQVSPCATVRSAEVRPGTLTRMPEDEPKPDYSDDGPAITSYGIGSAVLGVIAIVAIALAALIWTQHRHDADELHYRTRAMQAAADWSSVLINMNKDTVDSSLAQLHDGTVGQLNADFDAAVKPYRDLVQTLQSRTSGQVDSVAVEFDPPRPAGHTGPTWSTATRADRVRIAYRHGDGGGDVGQRERRWRKAADRALDSAA